MEKETATIEALRAQENLLGDTIAELEEAMLASSTPGIREFRRTRLTQLEDQRECLGHRLRRLESSPASATEAYLLGTAFRDATLVAQGTFGR